MNYIFELNQDSNEINYTYEEYSNEITSIKDISNNLYNTITEENRNNNTTNTNNTTTKKCKLLCNNFIKLNNCRWHKDNKCKFAHSYEELDDIIYGFIKTANYFMGAECINGYIELKK